MSDPKIKVHAEFTANTQAGEKANAVLAQTTQQANAAAAATAKLNAEGSKGGGLGKFAQLKADFAEAGGGLKGFMSVLLGSGATVAAWAAGIAGAFALAAKGLQVFAEKQQQVAKLDAVLANQGKLTDEYREKLQALAGAQAKATATSGNDWLQALTTLNKFGADTSNIDQYTEAVKNLAGFMEGGIPEAAFLFGKAMQGQHQMLTRYGIEVDSSKTRTEQLADIMRQAAEKGGGVLEARAQTITGQFDAFNGAIKKVFGGLGNLISQSGLVQAGLGALTGTLNLLAKVLPATVPAADGLKNSLSALSPEARKAAEALADLAHADVGDMGGVQKSAEGATGAVNAEVDALRKLQGELDQQGDENLKQKLAGIDLQESLAPKTAVNKEKFEAQRKLARRQNEQEKLGREDSTLTIAKDDTQGQLDARQRALDDFRAKAAPKLAELEGNANTLTRESGIENFGSVPEARAFLKKEIDTVKTELGGTIVRDSTRATGIKPGELEEELAAREKQLAALEGLPSALAALAKARDQVGKRDTELSAPINELAKQLATLNAQLAANATKRGTAALGSLAEANDAQNAARKARIQAEIDRNETQAKELAALRSSTQPGITEPQRAAGEAAAKALRDRNAYLKAGLEDDPTKRRGELAGLDNTTQSAGAGAALARNQQFGQQIDAISRQIAEAMQRGDQLTAQAFQRLLAATQKNQAEAARMLQQAMDAASRASQARP